MWTTFDVTSRFVLIVRVPLAAVAGRRASCAGRLIL
jgi:hypothetical protein